MKRILGECDVKRRDQVNPTRKRKMLEVKPLEFLEAGSGRLCLVRRREWKEPVNN